MSRRRSIGISIAGIINPCSSNARPSFGRAPSRLRPTSTIATIGNRSRHLGDRPVRHPAVEHPGRHRRRHRDGDHHDRQVGQFAEGLGIAGKAREPEVQEIADGEADAHRGTHLGEVQGEMSKPLERPDRCPVSARRGLRGTHHNTSCAACRTASAAASTSVVVPRPSRGSPQRRIGSRPHPPRCHCRRAVATPRALELSNWPIGAGAVATVNPAYAAVASPSPPPGRSTSSLGSSA